MRATSSIRSTSRRDVAGAPGGNRDRPVVGDVEAEPLEDLALLGGSISSPISASVRSGRSRVTGRRAAAPHERRRALSKRAPVSSTMSCVANTAAGSARYGSTPFSHRFEPSVRSPRRSEVLRMPIGSKFAASSRTSVVVSPTSDSSPPMIAASATGRTRVRDEQVARLERPQRPVERHELLAGAARRTTIRPPARRSASNACSGLPSASIT